LSTAIHLDAASLRAGSDPSFEAVSDHALGGRPRCASYQIAISIDTPGGGAEIHCHIEFGWQIQGDAATGRFKTAIAHRIALVFDAAGLGLQLHLTFGIVHRQAAGICAGIDHSHHFADVDFTRTGVGNDIASGPDYGNATRSGACIDTSGHFTQIDAT